MPYILFLSHYVGKGEGEGAIKTLLRPGMKSTKDLTRKEITDLLNKAG